MFRTSVTSRLLICISLVYTTVAVAADDEPRWYDIELVIFENIEVPRSPNALWEKQAYVPALGSAPKKVPKKLSKDTYRLSEEAKKIAKSSRYKLLVHRAWRQVGKPLEDSTPVQIRAGQPTTVFVPRFDAEFISPSSSDIDLADTSGSPLSPIKSVENFQPAFINVFDRQYSDYSQALSYPLDGTVTVALGRYLHVYSNLALTKNTANSNGAALQTFFINSHRRMRSRKLHYIDHPKIGMLVLITPYEPEE